MKYYLCYKMYFCDHPATVSCWSDDFDVVVETALRLLRIGCEYATISWR